MPKYNLKIIIFGAVVMGCAVFSFWQALDEYKDYLRIWHGMWHVFISISSFYLWQCDRTDSGIGWIEIWKYS